MHNSIKTGNEKPRFINPSIILGLLIFMILARSIFAYVEEDLDFFINEKKFRFFVDTKPLNAKVRILNVDHIFQQGMELKPGRYHIEVTEEGYINQEQWVELETKDKRIMIELKKKEEPTPILPLPMVRSISQECMDFVKTRVHKLETTYLPNTNLLVFYAAGTPGGICKGSVTIIEVANNVKGPWTKIGEHKNSNRRGKDDTIHVLKLLSPVAFCYLRITTPVCYTDCSAVTVGMSEQESRKMIKFPRRWE